MYPDENLSPAPEPQKPAYSPADTAFAWLSLVFAYFFCDLLPITKHPLGGFLLILSLFVTGFVILRLKKQKLSPVCILSALSALVIGGALLLTDTEFLVNLSFAYALASFCYFVYAAFGNRIEAGFSDYIYIDFIKILLILPFRSMGAIFPAMSNKSTQKGSRFLLKALLGVGIAIIPTVLVFANLSYDAGFTKILDELFVIDSEKVGHIIRCLIFTLPLAMYGFGLYASSAKKALHDQMNAQSCQKGLRKMQILPQLTALVAVLPILFLYVVFFISQWQYYVSGFTGVLPENYSYAEYARQGFFELCSVSVINLVLIIGIALFIKRGKKDSSVILKLVALIFCLCTLILISTAVAKLVMYIDYYGLTQKRIYAMWLMALIGIVFLIVALGQFVRRFKVVAVSVCVAILMFAGLAVCNVGSLCAQYNTERYLSGSLEQLDVNAMEELGDSAIPSLVQIATSEKLESDPALKQAIDLLLYNRQLALLQEEASFFSFSLPSAMAKAALQDYVPNVPPAGTYVVTKAQVNESTQKYLDKDACTVTIYADRTGSIAYGQQTKPFLIVADKLRLEDMAFTITCRWTDENKISHLALTHESEEAYYRLILEPAE